MVSVDRTGPGHVFRHRRHSASAGVLKAVARLAVVFSAGGDGGRTRKGMSVDTIEDIAVLGALLVFSSLSLAVIVLLY